MASSRTIASAVVAMLVLSCCAGARAADAQQVFDDLFGKEAKEAVTPKAAADFAAKLLRTAKELKDDPQFTTLLLVKAHEFGVKDPQGYPTAVESLKLLMDAVPAKREEYLAKLVDISNLQFQRAAGADKPKAARALIGNLIRASEAATSKGNFADAIKFLKQAQAIAVPVKSIRCDEIANRINYVTGRIEAVPRCEGLKSRLTTEPKDAGTAKALVTILVADLDNPAEAGKYVVATGDEAMKMFTGLAARDIKDVPETALVDLADWYARLAVPAGPAGKVNALRHARTCYERFLNAHPQKDKDHLKAQMGWEQVQKDLGKIAPEPCREVVLGKDAKAPFKLVLVPAGKFMMGTPKDTPNAPAEEMPQHEVTISRPFYMGEIEVTQEQYYLITNSTPSRTKKAPKNPVENISWNDAVEFCRKVSLLTGETVRLPTEAEWECACRAGTTTRYYFGDDEAQLGDYAWFKGNSQDATHEVRTKKPNALGLYDMLGNAMEWCSDFMDANYYSAKNNNVDPQGPPAGAGRVYRGGSCRRDASDCRPARRPLPRGEDTRGEVGMRIVVDLD